MKKRWILLLLLIGIAGFVFWRGKSKPAAATDPAKTAGDKPVAVILGTAEQRDVPVWLTGIGSAQASNMVTVRPRVSGSLDKVNFTEGAFVKAGDVLAQIDPRPYQSILSQVTAKKSQDEAQLNNARLEATRFQNLQRDDAVSRQQLEQANATAAQLAALVEADNAAVQAAQLDLDFTTVRAPIAGRTGVRLVDAGNIVTANQGAGLVVLTELQPISVIFTLSQQNLPALGKNMQPGANRLTVQALAEDGTQLDEGELELIDNQIDSATGTLKLKATFKNDKLTLWPGQFVTARVLVETRKAAIVVPPESIQPGLDGQFVYVVGTDEKVTVRTVKTGITATEGAIIEDGLKGGDRIVVTGQNKLRPGVKVAAQQTAP